MKKKALVAMSGGVDSSVAAVMMQKAGWDCLGVTMNLHENRPEVPEGVCGAPGDAEDAKAVASHLGMPHETVDYSAGFRAQVMSPFVCAYEKGETPNPCIACNRYMKFGTLLQLAKERGCEGIATGHYAQVVFDPARNRYLLKKSANSSKDQSYVLYFLTQEQLAHIHFPLGKFSSKEEVREVAKQYGFVTAKKQDSQDICFIPDGKYATFIREYTQKEYPHGEFVDTEGKVLGEHKGIICYTVGQRKGLGLALPAPLYVQKIDTEQNRVVLSPNDGLYGDELIATDFNWISGDAPEPGASMVVTAKTRYHAKEAAASATVLENGDVRVHFAEPQRAITRGQAVVLYQGDEVVGGGRICG